MTHLTEMVAKMICSPPPGQLERFPETPGSCQFPVFHLSWVQTQRLLQRTRNLPPLSLFVWQPSPLLSQPTWPFISLGSRHSGFCSGQGICHLSLFLSGSLLRSYRSQLGLSSLLGPDTAAFAADKESATSLSFCLAAFSALIAANLAFFLSNSALRSAILQILITTNQ